MFGCVFLVLQSRSIVVCIVMHLQSIVIRNSKYVFGCVFLVLQSQSIVVCNVMHLQSIIIRNSKVCLCKQPQCVHNSITSQLIIVVFTS